MKFQIDTGQVLGATKCVPVRYVFLMADTDAMGEAGISFLKTLADAPVTERMPMANLYLESRYAPQELRKYGLSDTFFNLDTRRLTALAKIGCHMGYNHINHHSIPAPCFGENVAMGSTPSAIYANSALGARTNFEAGPAGIATALTGCVPYWGLHLDNMRIPKVRFHIAYLPQNLSEWGALGAYIGTQLQNMNDIPILTGISEKVPALALNHLGASMASYGAVGMFHIQGTTPEAHIHTNILSNLPTHMVTQHHIQDMLTPHQITGKPLDLVVIGTPQMCWTDILDLHKKLQGKTIHPGVTMFAFTDKGTFDTATALGVSTDLANCECTLLDGIDYFQAGSDIMRIHNGWSVALTPSCKLANILNGAGYKARAISLDDCIASAIQGRVI